MPKAQTIQAVVFDLDGTLLNTIADLASAVNYALATHGRPVRTDSEIRSFLGNGIRRLVAEAVPEDTTESDYEAIFATFRQACQAGCARARWAMRGSILHGADRALRGHYAACGAFARQGGEDGDCV